mmetsp:Transcript_36823/g.96463  ORF Transcript_36823/g.96463 Transcript_36823/m.96463 type:complete len:379 (+) Transcript_36823:1-1137(+)
MWWEKFGPRRYGSSNPAAVAAWARLGATIFAANPGNGFGSQISTFPSMPAAGPSPPVPPAPQGFHAYTKRGFFGGYVAANPLVRTVDGCAQLCLNTTQGGKKCEGFEVYIDVLPATGNCYLFFTLTTPFTPLGPCATYIRDGNPADYSGVPRPSDRVSSHAIAAAAASLDSPVVAIFEDVWQSLLVAAPQLGNVESYHFDLVDVGREVIAGKFAEEKATLIAAYMNGSATAVAASTTRLLAIVDDYDLLLSADSNFMLGRWVSWAEEWSDIPSNKEQLRFNAINILTLWGPTGQINDYAKKEWSGLVGDYYKARWQAFTDAAAHSIATGSPWDQGAFSTAVFNSVELPFQNTTKAYPITPEVNAVAVATQLAKKYIRQ